MGVGNPARRLTEGSGKRPSGKLAYEHFHSHFHLERETAKATFESQLSKKSPVWGQSTPCPNNSTAPQRKAPLTAGLRVGSSGRGRRSYWNGGPPSKSRNGGSPTVPPPLGSLGPGNGGHTGEGAQRLCQIKLRGCRKFGVGAIGEARREEHRRNGSTSSGR